jgi:hypothetical protein
MSESRGVNRGKRNETQAIAYIYIYIYIWARGIAKLKEY